MALKSVGQTIVQFFLVWPIPVSRLLWWTSLNFWSHPLICLANAQLTAWRATKTHEEQPSERFKLLVFRRLETSRHHSNWSSSSKCSSPSQILWPFDYSPTQLSKWTSSSPTGFHDQHRSVFKPSQLVSPCGLPEGSWSSRSCLFVDLPMEAMERYLNRSLWLRIALVRFLVSTLLGRFVTGSSKLVYLSFEFRPWSNFLLPFQGPWIRPLSALGIPQLSAVNHKTSQGLTSRRIQTDSSLYLFQFLLSWSTSCFLQQNTSLIALWTLSWPPGLISNAFILFRLADIAADVWSDFLIAFFSHFKTVEP